VCSFKKFRKDTLPSKIYLDTCYLIDALIQTESNPTGHKNAETIAKNLKNSKTTIICSELCYIEFWSAAFGIKLEMVCGNKKIKSIIGSKFEKEVFDWTKKQYANLITFLEILTNRADFGIKQSVGIYGMGKKIDNKAKEVAIKYKLPIYDAIHYYTMLMTNTTHIITNNVDDFEHLKKIYIWKYR